MKITFVLPDINLGGGTRAIAAHAGNLSRRGHQVSVIAPPRKDDTLRRRARDLLRGTRWLISGRGEWAHFDNAGLTPRILKNARPVTDGDVPDADVVIATWWETAEWVFRLSARKGAKVYFLQHFEGYLGQPVDRVSETWRLPFQKIACSQWLADLARDQYGDPNAVAAPNGVDHQLFHAEPRGKQKVPTFGMLYSTNRAKGCDISLRAFTLARDQAPGLRMIVLGDQRVSPDLPVPAGAQFFHRPRQHRLRSIYASCDAWLFGSRWEGFGLPLLEAMACRTPVIGTPAGAGAALISEENGVPVRVNDAEDMANAIERVRASSEQDWIRMSDAALDTASQYTWERLSDRPVRAGSSYRPGTLEADLRDKPTRSLVAACQEPPSVTAEGT